VTIRLYESARTDTVGTNKRMEACGTTPKFHVHLMERTKSRTMSP